MRPASHDYHLLQIKQLTSAFSLFTAKHPKALPPTPVPTLYVAAGQPIFSGHEPTSKMYLVTSGEVLMLRNERPVDLLERGDLLDLQIWPNATAVALHDCTLELLATPVLNI